MKFISLFFLCIFLLFFSCKKEKTYTDEEIMEIVLALLDLDCDETIESEYYLKGTLGGEAFCHHSGIDGYEVYTGIGNTFTTTSPSVSTGEDPANISNFSRFFHLSFKSDKSTPFPEEEVSVEIKLPNEGDQVEDFLKIMQADYMPYITWESDQPGVIISLEQLVRLNSESDGHTGEYFPTSRGDQTNSFCKINNFTYERSGELLIGEISLSFKADLYYSKSSKMDGFWKTIEADMVIPYQMPFE